MPELPSLRETVAAHGLLANKSLGQHFLFDLNVTRKIAGLTGAGPADTVLEIGPGPGGLTRALLETGAAVVAVERDRRVAPILGELASAYPGRLTAVEADALSVDETEIVPPGTIVASNLPYNISTELLIKWLKADPPWWSRLVLMFQREVGDRIVARPGSKTFGRLSVLAQAASRPQRGFNLPARAFTPPPKVASTVIVFDPRPLSAAKLAGLERVTAAAFGQRRKMIRQSLRPLFGETLFAAAIAEIGIDDAQRAETLSVADYLALTDIYTGVREA